MKKNKIITIIVLTILLIMPVRVKANTEYYINNYDLDIIINENNTLNITETIDAYFSVPKHGIFRKIPLKNTITRLDGTTSHNRASLTNINVNENYSVSKESGYKVIKIGDPNNTFTGSKQYTISYLYNLGKDTGKDYDELYYNLVGDEWDTSINNVNFKITMPKEFDQSKVGFSYGRSGSTNSSNINYKVDGNIITGKLNSILNEYEGLTIRLELPEGYYVGAKSDIDIIVLLSIILPILFIIISILLWSKYGKDDIVVDTVEFYPPEGFNSAELAFLYKGNAESKDIVSLLVYLANKGYIKIGEVEKKGFLTNSKSFKITKIKDYDGNNPNESLFLKELFESSSLSINATSFKEVLNIIKDPNKLLENKIENKNEVTEEDLYDSFYITINKIKQNINNKQNKQKLFEKNSLTKGLPIILMMLFSFILINIAPALDSEVGIGILFVLIFPIIGFSILFKMVFESTNMGEKIFGLIWGLSFGGIPLVAFMFALVIQNASYTIAYIIGLISIIVMAYIHSKMPKRTQFGREMLGKIKGFKKFLETAEKDKLEAMVNENPSYFFDILPFTYVLGVSTTWIKKFETIAQVAPTWYDSTTPFNMTTFGDFMDSTMTSASTAMTSSPSESSSSSGGSSGGGCSGGGSGGGGGGSW